MDAVVRNSGRITLVRLDAYGGDIRSANGTFSIDWGEIHVGESRNVSFHLQSISNVPTTLLLSLDDWQPEGIDHFLLISWNYSGTQIAPNEEICILIELKTSLTADFVDYLIANHVTSFGFSLSICALEY